jgi:hypothetical protein
MIDSRYSARVAVKGQFENRVITSSSIMVRLVWVPISPARKPSWIADEANELTEGVRRRGSQSISPAN